MSLRGYSSCGWRHSGDGARGSPSLRNNTLYPLNSIPYLWQASHRVPERRCCEPNIKLASIQAELFFLDRCTLVQFTHGSQPQRFRSSDVHQNVHEKAKYPRKRGEATGVASGVGPVEAPGRILDTVTSRYTRIDQRNGRSRSQFTSRTFDQGVSSFSTAIV